MGIWWRRSGGAQRRAVRRGGAERETGGAARCRPRRWAIPPALSGDPEIGLSARTATSAAYPHQRLSALCSPPIFWESGKRDRGTRPSQRASRALAARVIPGPESMNTEREDETQIERQREA